MCSGMPTESLAMGGTSAGICVYLASMAETSLPTLASTTGLTMEKALQDALEGRTVRPFHPHKGVQIHRFS